MALCWMRRSGTMLRGLESLKPLLSRAAVVESLGAVQGSVAGTLSLAQSEPEQSWNNVKSGLVTFFGTAALAGYAHERMRPSIAYTEAAESAPEKKEDEFALYRRVKQKHGLPHEVILYQYEVCPFCNKVRAFLDYHNVPYRVVEVNPLTKGQLKWSEYKKVPVVMLDDDVVNDSSTILSQLAVEFEPEKQPQKAGSWFSKAKETVAEQTDTDTEKEEMKWRRWVDKTFVQLITVNIYRTAKESWQTFDYITSHGKFNFLERQAARVSGSTLMYAISGRLIKKYGVEGDLREALYKAAEEWVDAVGERQFKGGDQPDLADLSVFGVIRSITGTDTFQDLMHETRISAWYERMMKAVGSSSRLPN